MNEWMAGWKSCRTIVYAFCVTFNHSLVHVYTCFIDMLSLGSLSCSLSCFFVLFLTPARCAVKEKDRTKPQFGSKTNIEFTPNMHSFLFDSENPETVSLGLEVVPEVIPLPQMAQSRRPALFIFFQIATA